MLQFVSRKHNAKFNHSAINICEEDQMFVNLQTWSHDLDHAYLGNSQWIAYILKYFFSVVIPV